MNLLVVDESLNLYQRLLHLLGGVECLTALSVARSLCEVVAKCSRFQADVAVIDVHLPDGSGLEAIAHIKVASPYARIFLCADHIDFWKQTICSGVDGFFDKSRDFDALLKQLIETRSFLQPKAWV